MRYRYIFLFFTCKILFGQLSITGSLKPTGMFQISDQSRMDLPFRLAELKLGYTMGDFDFMLNSAVEYRWGGNNPVFDYEKHIRFGFPIGVKSNLGNRFTPGVSLMAIILQII